MQELHSKGRIMSKGVYAAASAMWVEQRSLDVTARNIAHALSPGYRKEVVQRTAFVDELEVILRWALGHVQAEGKGGGSVYLRLSTRALEQPKREMAPVLAAEIVEGGYWLRPPGPSSARSLRRVLLMSRSTARLSALYAPPTAAR